MSSRFPMVPLKEIVQTIERPETVIAGKLYRQIGVRLWGGGAYEREAIDGSQTKYQTLSRVEANDIIVNKIWARNGSVAVVTEALAGCYGSGEFPTFSPDHTMLEPRWFHWLTKTKGFWEQCDEKSQGTSGKNRIRPERFLKVTMPLAPLEEQRRIVTRIEELAAKVEEARGLRRKTVEETEILFKATMRHAFQKMEDYQEIHLEDVCSQIIDNLHSNPIYADDGIPCVRSPDVGWGKLYLDSALRTDEAEFIRRTVRGVPSKNDIVLVREGGGTGKAAIVEDGQRFSLGQRVMMLRPNDTILPRFLLYQLLSPLIYEEQILPVCKGSASPHLNIGALRKFMFRRPPLSEQRRIVAYLDDLQARVDAVKQLQAEMRAELDGLLPSILDKAFRGELV